MVFEFLEQILDPEPHAAAFNMALDEALLGTVRAPGLRVYRWARPAVSFGCFERFQGAVEEYPGREPVRRWTGGGIVPHGEDVTYSLFVPAGFAFGRLKAAESYRVIHEGIRGLLASEGLSGSLAGAKSEGASRACFAKPVNSDILMDGRKIAGGAQRRTRLGLLHQGSIQNVELPREFEKRLAGAFSAVVGTRELTGAEIDAASRLAEEKYGAEEWTRRY